MSRQLLVEYNSSFKATHSEIQESVSKNDGRLIIRNVLLQRADTPNKNKRVYPKRILERELQNYMQSVKNKDAFSELDHPMGEEGNVVSVKNVCQAILDAHWKGNEIYGDVEILPTRSGNDVRAILMAGYRLGQSSRGLGSVKPLREGSEEDLVEVQDDFELITLADIVSNPSTHNANMKVSVTENYTQTSNGVFMPERKLINMLDNILLNFNDLK